MSFAPRPSSLSDLHPLTEALDALDHEQRLAWAYSLDETEQLALYALAAEQSLSASDLVSEPDQVVIHPGRNGFAFFNHFQKRFALLGDEIVGYNHNADLAGPFNFIARRLIGPGHFTAYDAPDEDAVWIDYRKLPSRRHPAFPKIVRNDRGIRSLVFGNLVDVLRRVSDHVTIGNAFKDKSPPPTLGCRLGAMLPVVPFVLVRSGGDTNRGPV